MYEVKCRIGFNEVVTLTVLAEVEWIVYEPQRGSHTTIRLSLTDTLHGIFLPGSDPGKTSLTLISGRLIPMQFNYTSWQCFSMYSWIIPKPIKYCKLDILRERVRIYNCSLFYFHEILNFNLIHIYSIYKYLGTLFRFFPLGLIVGIF